MKVMLLMFDYDGVIADSSVIAHQTGMEVFDKNMTVEEHRRYFDGNIRQTAHSLEQGREVYRDDDPFQTVFIPRFIASSTFENIPETILRMAQGNSMAIVSSSVSGPIRQHLQRHGLKSVFDKVYGVDVHASKVIKIRQALKDLHSSVNDSVFITDTLGDIREANEVGVRSIAVTWGYQKRENLMKGNPYTIVDSPKELEEVVSSFV